MILVAIPEPLRSRILPAVLMDELRALAPVAVAPTPGDLLTDDTRGLLAETAVLVAGWGSDLVDASVLAAAPRLWAVVHTAGSVRPVVTRDVYARGVLVSSQAWANALPVAEYALAMILLSAKGVHRMQRRLRAARDAVDAHAELASFGTYGTRVGIIGASAIGRRVIELLAPFDLSVALSDPTVGAEEAASLGVTPMSLDELMRTSRVVSVHAPLLDSTVGMIGAPELAALPDGATFINTARGALVDEDALIRELQSGRIDAVLDVTWPEPPAPESPLWTLPNVTLTPHVAGSAGNELVRMGSSAVREVARIFRAEPLHHPVGRNAYERLAQELLVLAACLLVSDLLPIGTVDGFEGVADPLRRDLLRRLAAGPARVVDLAAAYDVSRPAVSRHLRLLTEAGLASAENRGRERHYRLDPTGVVGIRVFLDELDRASAERPAPPRFGKRVLDALDTEVRRTRRDHRTALRTNTTEEQTG